MPEGVERRLRGYLLVFLSFCLFVLLSMITRMEEEEEVPIQANHESVKPLYRIILGCHVG